MLVLLTRFVAAVMWFAYVVPSVALGGIVGGVIGFIVALAGSSGQLSHPTIYVGLAAGGLAGFYWATRLWIKTLHPVMGSEPAAV